ncbi:hypothetical protein [Flavobacterium sp. SORGH_AS_0622]|uniref:hypothetical protein n=1 Tax=Flavobacterium sp. SORGH_AS_0622 TaxID=3041772 RepID=UPI00278B7B65|nr:hypothetical protein [Flavobacterium sp. SORGH_AS_0622]MDQ1166387.1 hypothetical protein [Flavobacterium sp. SORGH_AS_0622]
MEGVQIFEQEFLNSEGNVVGKMAILVGGLQSRNPKEFMDNAVHQYVGTTEHNQYIEIHMDNPWTRLITTGINELPLRPLKISDSLKN